MVAALGHSVFLRIVRNVLPLQTRLENGDNYMVIFLILGYVMAIYFNSQEPQPRERDYFYVGAYFVFSIWIGIGVRGMFAMIKDALNKKTYLPAATTAMALAFLLIPANMLLTNFHSHDRSRNFLPWDYAYNLLQSVAPNSVLFTNGDNDTFPLWYLQDVEGVRRDVRIANLSLLNTNWYIKQLKNQEPYGAMKVAMSLSDREIDQLAPTRWKTTPVSIKVPESVYKEFGITDTTQMMGELKWKFEPTLKYGSINAVRVQDLVVFDIIKNFKWKRPIYFSVTCSDDSHIGLDKYLKMEGLAYRLVPEKAKNELTFINEPVMRAQLFDTTDVVSKTYRPGLKFRGLNDPTIFFNANQIRLIQNYRNSFIRLALYYLYVQHNNKMTVATLDMMERKLPRHVIPMDYRLMFDVSGIYQQAGAMDKYLGMVSEIEKTAWNMIAKNPRNITSTYNPYRMLFEIYENTKQYDKALKVVDALEKILPGDKTVDMLRKKYTSMLNAKNKN